ncbi:phospholipase B-like protein [Tieghemostelium lacteum]|uniref:Phospholipase B-like n=1 Tax=Tieghemostelium lacteum TaxID=361077 RepID=A0A151ZJE8_TIELA|nr:phospholipase B-like protein [Tieghemostelium lacteum]|eukprot:KYQ94010.1 phospholipase B-like protein [Tieghemostelium lacteum]
MKSSIFIFLIFILVECHCKKVWYSIDDQLQITPGKNNSGSIGSGYFKDEIEKDGWGKLYIQMNNPTSNQQSNSYYAAGYIEAYLTSGYIYNFSQNYFLNQFNTTNLKEFPMELLEFADTNSQWMLETFQNDTTPFGRQVMNVMQQFDGLVKGYNDNVEEQFQLDPMLLLLMNYVGDLDDIAGYFEYLNDTESAANKVYTVGELQEIFSRGHCSALIKVPSDYSELYSSHTTWSGYYSMLRIFKRIIIPDVWAPNGYDIYYSGYPGILTSDDDYFIIKPSNLVVTETTNSIINMSLYSQVKPTTLLYWVRSMVANRLANSGQEWIDNYVPYQSGTYNNQWMIVDYKLFTPFSELQNGTLMIMESIPGEYMSADVTGILSFGYWSSFNIPYFPRFQQLMGYTYYETLYGDMASYSLNPRAKIFRRDQNNVESLSDMQAIMLSNMYLTDPYSDGFPGSAIASRYDLYDRADNPPFFVKIPSGAIDSKVTSSQLASTQLSMAYSGPTVTPDCPPFSFDDWEDISHLGLPQTFNFDWVQMTLDQ